MIDDIVRFAERVVDLADYVLGLPAVLIALAVGVLLGHFNFFFGLSMFGFFVILTVLFGLRWFINYNRRND